MTPYKVLVVDDSAFMRKMITDFIHEDPNFQVIDSAKNGLEAIEMTKELRPDVITMDIEMPEVNGLEALKEIMAESPTPVIMLSNYTDSGAAETIQALEWGAIDFVKKPSGSISLDLHKVKDDLLEKLRIAVQKHTNIQSSKKSRSTELMPKITKTYQSPPACKTNDTAFEHLVAIGTSTGGPKALHFVISQIPKSFPAPILIVQHMPPKFTLSLAERLNSVAQIEVVEATHLSIVKAGTAYIAPGGKHMTLQKDGPSTYRIVLNDDEPRFGHRPSVDILFESLIPYDELKRHIVIMTGMGSDGARGMKKLKEAGATSTIAESNETCVVFGMPRSAIELGAAQYIVPLYQIPSKLVDLVD